MTLARAELSGEINKKHDNSITAQQKFLKNFQNYLAIKIYVVL